jgi:hypothetical protein
LLSGQNCFKLSFRRCRATFAKKISQDLNKQQTWSTMAKSKSKQRRMRMERRQKRKARAKRQKAARKLQQVKA